MACKFVLQSGATSLAQRGYDIAPLASEKVLSPELIVDPKAAPTRPHLLPDAKQVSKKANDNSESQAMSNEPQGTMPWSIIVVLIVGGASGLLWLLLKRRS